MARFFCILGEYLGEEVVWVQIDPESLTRPSALAMVGGRCQGDHQQGGAVELFSSEGSSQGGGEDLRNLEISHMVGKSRRCVGVLTERDASANCSLRLRGGRHLPTLLNWVKAEPHLHQVLLWRRSSSSVKTTAAVPASVTPAVVLLFCASFLL